MVLFEHASLQVAVKIQGEIFFNIRISEKNALTGKLTLTPEPKKKLTRNLETNVKENIGTWKSYVKKYQ